MVLDLGENALARVEDAIRGRKQPEVLLFRVLGPQLQQRFISDFSLNGVPHVLLHGNPHLENYVRTHNGAGLTDFDRSRVGPTLWDIYRALSSITFWSSRDRVRTRGEVSQTFLNAYLHSLTDPLAYWEIPDMLRRVKPKGFQHSPHSYLASGKKWSKKVKKSIVDPDDQFYLDLFAAYLQNQPEGVLRHWEISQIAEIAGSMGKKHFVYVLDSEIDTREPIMLDIKETYIEEDNEFFHNPFDHQGVRMIAASRLYAPGLEERIGYCTLNEKHYWIRQIPSFCVKVQDGINHDEALQLAQAVGAQLGRGHRLTDTVYGEGGRGAEIEEVTRARFSTLLELIETLNQDILSLFQQIKH